MQAMIDRARLMVLVSHDLSAVQEICNRAIWMDHGRIRMDGGPQLVIEAYKLAMQSDDFKGPGAEIGRAA
jgi:ABC-type polysaccharide/polyol phosphate transport system ATPase subunit